MAHLRHYDSDAQPKLIKINYESPAPCPIYASKTAAVNTTVTP